MNPLLNYGFAKNRLCHIVSLVLSLADRTLEKANLDSGKSDLGVVSVGSNGIEPWVSLCVDRR